MDVDRWINVCKCMYLWKQWNPRYFTNGVTVYINMYVSINNIMCNIEVASYRLIACYYTITIRLQSDSDFRCSS